MSSHPIREEFPTSKFDPDPNCKHCKGEGVNIKPSPITGITQRYPCSCIYLNPEIRDFVYDAVNQTRSELYKGGQKKPKA